MSTYASPPRSSARPRVLIATMALCVFAFGSLAAAPAGAAHAKSSPDHGRLQVNAHNFGPGAANDFQLPCGFNVSFFGYDVGVQRANISVTPLAPNSGGLPFSIHVKWETLTRTSKNQLDQNVVISPSLVAKAFTASTSLNALSHAMISVQVNGKARSTLSFHSVWIASCNATSSANPASGTSPSGNSSGSGTLATPMPSFVVGATQRVGGTSMNFTSGPVRLVTGEQVQFNINVVNTGNVTLDVVLSDVNCDSLTTSPSNPQTLNPGEVLTFYCSHVVFTAPTNHRVLNVASVGATTTQRASVGAVVSTTTTLVYWPPAASAPQG